MLVVASEFIILHKHGQNHSEQDKQYSVNPARTIKTLYTTCKIRYAEMHVIFANCKFKIGMRAYFLFLFS
jgi:hypothetical protein